MGQAAVGTSLTCLGEGGTSSRIYYFESDGHVHELAWNGSAWDRNDLTAMTGAVPPSIQAGITCYADNGNKPAIHYIGTDSQVHWLAWTPGWAHDAGGLQAPADAGSPITSFFNTADGRVYYISNQHVHEIAYSFGQIARNDLTGMAAAKPAAANSKALTCLAENSTVPRVYYLSSDGHVQELAWTGTTWVTDDLMLLTGAVPAQAGTGLACYAESGSNPRVYYFGNDGNIHELAWVGTTWNTTDLISAAGAFQPVAGLALTCYGRGGTGSRVYYLGTDNHVRELAWEGHWSANDITSLAGAGPALSSTALTCFGVGGTDARVYYVSNNDNKIHELAWNNGWGGSEIG